MNKPAVMLLIGVSFFFTFVASGGNSKVNDQRLPEYIRLYLRIDTTIDEEEFAIWQVQSPSGSSTSTLGLQKIPGNEFYTLIGGVDGEPISKDYADFTIGLQDWRLRYEAKLEMLSETWEIFQVDVNDLNATTNFLLPVREEMIHFRRKSK